MIRIRLRQRGYALSPSVSIAIPSLMAKKKMKKKIWKAALAEKKEDFPRNTYPSIHFVILHPITTYT